MQYSAFLSPNYYITTFILYVVKLLWHIFDFTRLNCILNVKPLTVKKELL